MLGRIFISTWSHVTVLIFTTPIISRVRQVLLISVFDPTIIFIFRGDRVILRGVLSLLAMR